MEKVLGINNLIETFAFRVTDIIFVFTGESFGIVRNNSGKIVLLAFETSTVRVALG